MISDNARIIRRFESFDSAQQANCLALLAFILTIQCRDAYDFDTAEADGRVLRIGNELMHVITGQLTDVLASSITRPWPDFWAVLSNMAASAGMEDRLRHALDWV